MGRLTIILALVVFCLASCMRNDDTAYALYRSSTTGPMRIYVATFDSDAPEDYNRENCQMAMELFAAQPGVKVRFWCEKGRYRA